MAFDPQLFLKNLTTQPGVYQMFDQEQRILYVGKARNLKNRLSSYFHGSHTVRLQVLVKQIDAIEIIIAQSETEALLLENNLIKKLKPRYNILFRDDKSYPYIYVSMHSDFPRIDFHRGAKSLKGRYFGPYPSSGAVRESLSLMQKLFRIRQCRDTFFSHRTRPCIQYQIERCTAPCVNYITPNDYQKNVELAILFLEGKNKQIIAELMEQMQSAAASLEYERAALRRDQISALRRIQEQQYVTSDGGDVDVMAALSEENNVCVQVLFIRAGRMIGNHNFITKSAVDLSADEILQEFIPQFYLNPLHQRDIPKLILTNVQLVEKNLLETVLTETRKSKVEIQTPSRGKRNKWLHMAFANAKAALTIYLSDKANYFQRMTALQHVLKLAFLPQRIECFDISHSSGEATVASCVVFTEEGPDKSHYRRFNITNITPGDDYGALREAIRRRYARIKEEGHPLPDVILIDGGKGQLHQAELILEELQVSGVQLFSIAKGPGRKAGLETIYQSGSTMPIHLAADSLGMHSLQHIRDEAHRFAITGHKQRRDKVRKTSRLEEVEGVGKKRRQQLLNYFGGIQAIKTASVEQLRQVPGISHDLAVKIYDYFHLL